MARDEEIARDKERDKEIARDKEEPESGSPTICTLCEMKETMKDR